MSGRCATRLVLAAAGAIGLAAPVHAGDTGPVIVIPSRPGIPIVINGRDASYAVVEGDWGLARPGAVPVTVIGGSPIRPTSVYEPRRSYHPRYGRAPERGRNEVEPSPDRPLPEQAEGFSRNWSASSSDVMRVNGDAQNRPPEAGTSSTDIAPATITDPATFQQPIIIAPGDRRRRHP